MNVPTPLKNLRLLIARETTYGAPASTVFVSALTQARKRITESQVSDWLCAKKGMPSWDAREIEVAVGVPKGWLDADLEFVFKSSPDLISTFRDLVSLEPEQRDAFAQLIRALATQKGQTDRVSGEEEEANAS